MLLSAFRSHATHADLQSAVMLFGLACILLTGSLLGTVSRRFKQPVVVGEVVAGIVLGPSVLGLLPGHLPDRLFPTDVRPLLSSVSEIGLALFMFMVGWEFEKRLLKPHGALAGAVSASSIAVTFALGVGLSYFLYPRHETVAGHHVTFSEFAAFMGAAMSVTAFPVLARILTDNRLTHTRTGTLALASAAADDLLAWCMLAYVSAMVASRGKGDFLQVLGLSAGYILVMFLVVRPLLNRAVRGLTGRGQTGALLALLSSGAFVSSWATTLIGIHAIFGGFMFGLIMPRDTSKPILEVRKALEDISAVLLPVFFIVTGLGVDIGGLTVANVVELVAIVAVACVGKIAGTMTPARLLRLPWRESWALGLLMNTRGLTELVILNTGVQLGVLDTRMFTMMVIMALFTTALAGPFLPSAEELTVPDLFAPLSRRPAAAGRGAG